MGWFSRRNKDPRPGKLEFLNRYTMGQGDLAFLTEPPPASALVPERWRGLPLLAPSERVATAVELMRATVGVELRNTISYVAEYGTDVELVRLGEDHLLLYTIVNRSGSTLYYAGGNPLQRRYPPVEPAPAERGILPLWDRVPVPLRTFYEQTHDGFYYFPSRSMGLNPVWEVRCLADYDLGARSRFADRLASAYTFFSGTSDDHVLVDLARPDEGSGILWILGDDPDFDISFWDVVDEWTVIGFDS